MAKRKTARRVARKTARRTTRRVRRTVGKTTNYKRLNILLLITVLSLLILATLVMTKGGI